MPSVDSCVQSTSHFSWCSDCVSRRHIFGGFLHSLQDIKDQCEKIPFSIANQIHLKVSAMTKQRVWISPKSATFGAQKLYPRPQLELESVPTKAVQLTQSEGSEITKLTNWETTTCPVSSKLVCTTSKTLLAVPTSISTWSPTQTAVLRSQLISRHLLRSRFRSSRCHRLLRVISPASFIIQQTTRTPKTVGFQFQ